MEKSAASRSEDRRRLSVLAHRVSFARFALPASVWSSAVSWSGVYGVGAALSLALAGCGGLADGAAAEQSRRLELVSDAPLNGSSSIPGASDGGGLAIDTPHEPLPEPPPIVPPPPARFVPPLPPELAEGAGIIESYPHALALGKALFWDQQVGSDGQACASCHFSAGADARVQNQLNPGFGDLTTGSSGDTAFGSNRSDTGAVERGNMPSGNPAGSNATVVPEDFPLHRLLDEANANSPVVSDTNDVVGSAGAFAAEFTAIDEEGNEHCGSVGADIFHVPVAGGQHAAARQVEPRHTPTTINAVFNIRQFWDGRANNLFNGVGVFGLREIAADPDQRLIVVGEDGALELGYLQLENASLASQAVGPPLSDIEMSCRGRTFADIGRKLLRVAPLAKQRVSPADSVLGGLANPSGHGLSAKYTYAALIRAAFASKYWAASGTFSRRGGALVADPRGFTQMETNMSMFWGIAIMLYEATLISDQSPFDALLASGDITPQCVATDAVDPLITRGCKIFFRFPFGPPPADGVRGAGCGACHQGVDLFSEAAAQAGEPFPPLLQVPDINNLIGTRDLGFSNIGTRPTFVDVFLGGSDPFGNPLAFGREYRQYLDTGSLDTVLDPFLVRAIQNGALVAGTVNDEAKLESDGATKIPTVRNVGLNPPYFSYGGYSSLRQVMKFYNRGGNRRQITAENQALEAHGSACLSGDTTGSGSDGNQAYPIGAEDCNTNVTGLIRPLGLSDCDLNGVVTCDVANDDLTAVVRFMESLTDPRVQCDRAPFDHPSLTLNVGHEAELGDIPGAARDRHIELPEVGSDGYDPSSGFCIPNTGDLFAPGMQGRVGGPRVPL
jgi:cytochrome c peroxidase